VRYPVAQNAPVRVLVEDGYEYVRDRASLEGAPAGQAFVETAPECPDVGAPVDHLPTRLFRAHVGRGPKNGALSRLLDRRQCRFDPALRHVGGLCEAKVQELHLPVGTDLDVRRLEVAMDDARVVRRFEPLGNLPTDVERVANRKRAVPQPLGERLP
jgi:hypothetical protein